MRDTVGVLLAEMCVNVQVRVQDAVVGARDDEQRVTPPDRRSN